MKKSKENVALGAIFILLAAISFSCMGLAVKFLGSNMTDDETVFMRNLISLIIVLPFMFFPKKITPVTKVFPNHFVRGVSSVLAAYCLFYAIHHIALADAILLTNTMPLFVPFVMFFWKKERFPRHIFIPLIVSFVGIIMILRPGADVFHIASVVALGAGLFMSISTCGMRELGKSEPLPRILFYAFTIGTIISLMPLFWRWQTPSLDSLLVLIAIAIAGTLYQLFLVAGYQKAPPTKVSPFIYFAVIVSGIFDWLFWHQIPHYLSFIGLVLVCVGAIWCMKIESFAGNDE